jgi:N-acetylmuramoyl-L-alanine amidase CwlA
MVKIKTSLANKENYGGMKSGPNQWIVMHYTANDGDSDEMNAKYFRDKVVKASANYFVDDDSITCTVPDNWIAYHCGAYKYFHPSCRNYNSIGIEMCDAHRDGIVQATDKTIENAAELAAMLCEKYNIPTSHIIRHYDVTHKICPAYWVKDPDGIVRFRKMVEDNMIKPEQSYMIVNGKEKPVERILYGGQNFVKVRDMVQAMAGVADFEVSNKGNIPVLTME